MLCKNFHRHLQKNEAHRRNKQTLWPIPKCGIEKSFWKHHSKQLTTVYRCLKAYKCTHAFWSTALSQKLNYIYIETPLTLRKQRGCCRNIKGKPQIYGSFPSPMPRPLFLWVWFYGGPWQTQAVYQIWIVQLQPLCKYCRETPNFEELP